MLLIESLIFDINHNTLRSLVVKEYLQKYKQFSDDNFKMYLKKIFLKGLA